MRRYLFFRLWQTALAAWGILSVIFLLTRLVSSDAQLQSAAATGPGISAAAQLQLEQQLRHRYGTDLPLFYVSLPPGAPGQWYPAWRWHGRRNQYHRWLVQLGHGSLGVSYQNDEPVTALLAAALRYTLPLTLLATLLTLGLTLGLCLWLGNHARWRPPVLAALHGLQAAPLFLVALGLLLLFANPDALNWFPAYGLGEFPTEASWLAESGQLLYYLALPILSLVLVTLPGFVVQLDDAMQQELHAPYVATARAKGVSQQAVLRGHVLRNALLPTLTLLTELFPNLVAGSVVVEIIYALPGMGRLLAEAAATQNFPVLLGAVLVVALARLIGQVVADILYRWADPRIQLAA